MIKKTVYCDVCNKEIPCPKLKTIEVIFETEQTEGRYTTPYLHTATIDM